MRYCVLHWEEYVRKQILSSKGLLVVLQNRYHNATAFSKVLK